jgi:type IV pilus assembly protein PilX
MKAYITIKDQKGTVLVIAIIMLLILSIIGIYAMGSSTIEVKIAGQKKFYDASLNDADGGVHYVRALNPFATITAGPANPVPYNAPNSNFNFTVNVSCLGNSPPPVGSGNGYREGFRAFYYLIQSTGRNAPVALSTSSVNLEVEGYRIGFAGIY